MDMQRKHAQCRRLFSGILSAAMVLGSVMSASAEPAGTLEASENVSVESTIPVARAASDSNATTPSDSNAITPSGSNASYVLMNIPYGEFYEAEVNNSVAVDGFSSATKNKPRTGSLAGGSYHVNSDGSAIDGITFPVKAGEGVDLSGYKQVTDEDSVDITVTNRGTTTTTTYEGRDALFENEDYAYYILTDEPAYYKEATVGTDGKLEFGKMVGTVETIEGSAELASESRYGDYQITVTAEALTNAKVFAVVLGTEEGSSYGLRHLENIWRVTNLAFCTGFTDTVHNCPTSSAHYEAIMGQTINRITYYTEDGIFEIQVEIYVPVKFEGSVSVEDASINAGKTTVAVKGLPEDFDAEYLVDGLETSVRGGEMSFVGAAKGQYTLVISDRNGKYADMTASFILYTEQMPVTYSCNGGVPALLKAEGASEDEAADYIANITSVSVDGTEYAATGRGAVVLIGEDGTLVLDAEPFAGDGAHVVVVTSTGYQKLTFTYDPAAGDNTNSTDTPDDNTNDDSDSESESDSGSNSGSGSSGEESSAGRWVSVTLENGKTAWRYQAKSSDTDVYAGRWGYIRNPYAPAGQESYGWFHFGEDGIMHSGWFTDNDGNIYYLNPIMDGCQGAMLTGWQQIEGKWYFLRDWTGAPYGSLLRNGRTPDGYTVDADGVWDGGAKAE